VSGPIVVLDPQGNLTADGAARAALQAAPGRYRLHHAGALLAMFLDEGTGAVARPGEVLALCGDIAAMPLLGLMNLFGQNRETGRLVLKRGQVERVVVLHNGEVASIGSNLSRDRLGTYLVRLGRVTELALEQAQTEAASTGRRIGQVLLQRGFIDTHQLWLAIQEQITELFADVVQWADGSFMLYRVPADFPFPTTPPLPMQGLLLEAVRRADEMSVYRERIPSVNARLRRTAKPPPELNADTEEVLQALAVMGPETSVSDLAKVLQVAEFDATRVAYELLRKGLVELVKAQPNVPAVKLQKADEHRIEVFNLGFREIHDEVSRAGRLEHFQAGVHKYLTDDAGGFHGLFKGVQLDATGALSLAVLAQNLGRLVAEGHDPSTVLTEALNELTFFMLFQCGELLDPQSDEHLGRRVRLIHASLR
jgi:hypothetical protein